MGILRRLILKGTPDLETRFVHSLSGVYGEQNRSLGLGVESHTLRQSHPPPFDRESPANSYFASNKYPESGLSDLPSPANPFSFSTPYFRYWAQLK